MEFITVFLPVIKVYKHSWPWTIYFCHQPTFYSFIHKYIKEPRGQYNYWPTLLSIDLVSTEPFTCNVIYSIYFYSHFILIISIFSVTNIQLPILIPYFLCAFFKWTNIQVTLHLYIFQWPAKQLTWTLCSWQMLIIITLVAF